MEQEQRDILDLSSRLLNDRPGFLQFSNETQALIERISSNRQHLVEFKRDLHTLKGNTAIFGLSLISRLCHEAESDLEAGGESWVDCSPIVMQWERTCTTIRQLLGERTHSGIEIDELEYVAVLDAIRKGADRRLLEQMVGCWRLEPMRARLGRVAEQLSTIALTDPPQIGQADPVIGCVARGPVGRVSEGVADRPSGSTRLSG